MNQPPLGDPTMARWGDPDRQLPLADGLESTMSNDIAHIEQ
jgi:hypothetical protein